VFHDTASALFGVAGLRVTDAEEGPEGAVEVAHRDAGRHPEAIRHLTQAHGLFAALPDHYNQARTVGELGRAYLLAGDLREAGRLLASALDAMTALDSPYEQARIHVALADVAAHLGDADGARHHRELALAVYDALGAPEAQRVRLTLPGAAGNADDSGGGSSQYAG
jgi:tetratricopeptide (TPR) repeat protein